MPDVAGRLIKKKKKENGPLRGADKYLKKNHLFRRYVSWKLSGWGSRKTFAEISVSGVPQLLTLE